MIIIKLSLPLLILTLSSCSNLSKKLTVIEKNFTNTVHKINDRKIEAVSGLSKKQHYHRHLRQTSVPQTENEILRNPNWQYSWIQDGISPTHNFMGARNNISYRGLRHNSHIQVVYDQYGRLVTSDENMGTYDFGAVYKDDKTIDQEGLARHFRKDVYPWIYWGNTENDKTTKKERLDAILKSIKGSKDRIKILNDLIY